MNARFADHPPSPRQVAAWLEDMTDSELAALFASAPDLVERLRVQLGQLGGADTRLAHSLADNGKAPG